MKCPKCQFENPEESKFCGGCGQNLDFICPECGAKNPTENIFCNECGSDLRPVKEVSAQIAEPISPPVSPSNKIISEDTPSTTGERKHVTALFSDLTGYTAMSEKLDPEEVKDITSQIFGDISKIVAKYDGFIEKYAGDAVMAIFGVPNAHEDDPVRAVKAAREIHELVDAVSPEIEIRIGQPISMHTGINTGLVVTGEVNMDRGTHGVAGDTINLASRLSNLAKPGEILIDTNTCLQAEGLFVCECLEETTVKGKADPVKVHKVLSQRDKPVTIHRLSGLRADLVGRKVELTELFGAIEDLKGGKGRIFSICGEAGTGKSRLVEEFKATLDFEQIQWIEGHAYAYSQNIPYFPLIDLLNRIFHIEENDPPEKLREKVEFGIEDLVGQQEEIVPYVGGLYSLSYAEAEEVSPEFWKSRLQSAIKAILSALANRAPTIYFLEDLHWADPSFVELLRQACLEIREPAIVICVYRPTFSLFKAHQLSSMGKYYYEIRLQDLSPSEAQDMLESLLKTTNIPSDLKRLVHSKAEGNPFYLEEMVNSLIESETLVRDNGNWKFTKSISQIDVSSSIHGLISGRLDRLDQETKRILQEASVIGRAFLYDILLKITELKDTIDKGLNTLERLDLIRTRSLQPDLEYMFKHPLTQEVVYNGLLKKERQEIHEQIARVIEQLFKSRLPEFHETLAFHYKQGLSLQRAIDYLVKSGEKSLKRYAIEESHQYYKEAFELLSNKSDKSKNEKNLLIDILIKWAFVFYYRGNFRDLNMLLDSYKGLAESLDDYELLGMFYAWCGFVHVCRGNSKDAYPYLKKSLNIGEKFGIKRVIGYACSWLVYDCLGFGHFEDAIRYGEKALEIATLFESDHYLYFKTLGGLAWNYNCKGDIKKAFETEKALLEYGKKHSENRSLFLGYAQMGYSHFVAGDLSSAITYAKKSIAVSVDPFYAMGGKYLLAMCYLLNDHLEEAENNVNEILKFSRKFGCELWEKFALMILGVIRISKGRMNEGLKMIEDVQHTFLRNEQISDLALCECILGSVYLQMVEGVKPINLLTMVKNIGFIVKNVPFARKKAEDHFNNAIEISKRIGDKPNLSQAYLNLGLLYKAKKKKAQAKKFISDAIEIFEECGAEVYLEQAKEELQSLQ